MLGYPVGPNVITWCHKSEAGRSKLEQEDTTIEAEVREVRLSEVLHFWLFRWRKGPMSQEMQVASRNWKKQRNGFSSRFLRGTQDNTLMLAQRN